MKRRLFVTGLIVLLLLPAGFLMSQNLEYGINFGNSMLNWHNDSWESEYPIFGIGFGDTYIPKTLSASLSLPVASRFRARFKAGFGIAKSSSNYDKPSSTIYYTDQQGVEHEIEVLRYSENIKTMVKGFSVDVTILYPVEVNSSGTFLIYPGIGIGYNYYTYSGEWDVANEASSVGGSVLSEVSGNFEAAKLAGLEQHFVLGFEIKTFGRLSIVMEFSKLGYSFMTQTFDIDETRYEETGTENLYSETFRHKIAEQKSKYSGKGGLSDIGIVFGIKLR